MEEREAWLFDVYPEREGMVLWFITKDDERVRLTHEFTPSLFIDGVRDELNDARKKKFFEVIKKQECFECCGFTSKLDFWTGKPRNVLDLKIINLLTCKRDLIALSDAFPELTYYNCDIPPEILYCYHTGLFPTARCRIAYDSGILKDFTLNDDSHSVEYSLPPFREVELRAEKICVGRRPQLHSLTVRHGNESRTWDEGSPKEILRSFRSHIEEIDPDIIWTNGGDAALFATLFELSQHHKVPLGLDREHGISRKNDYDGHTYMSYGRVLYHAPDYPLYGRWHIDINNSFWADACSLEGLVEVARMAKTPVQRAARRSIGTGISSIQLDWAYNHGYLIPWRKSQHESWKSVWTFMHSDRGGLVFQPITGVYEDVWELDFVSMYPSIMVRENISPETINCACCVGAPVVPELGYQVCQKRQGLTAETLQPVIDKRNYYKSKRNLLRQLGDESALVYDNCQDALKWLLVCCFGYLGYRNARFGRIEAHESTCAFSREKLLKAKTLCEDRGFAMLHAIVDSLWIKKDGCTREEIESLCDEINKATNLNISIEGNYSWLVFMPSRQSPDIPVPNRYFGAFDSGELKYRGIETRRSDQALYIKEFQKSLLDKLKSARSLLECKAMKEELVELVHNAEDLIRSREVPPEKLFLRRKTTKPAGGYKNNNMTAVASRQAVKAGINLHAGEAVQFLVLNQKDKDPDSRIRIVSLLRPEDHYDVEFYIEQLHRASATILEPIMGETIDELLGIENKRQKPERKPLRIAQLELFPRM